MMCGLRLYSNLTVERKVWEQRANNGRTREFILVGGGRQILFVFMLASQNDPITSHVLDEVFFTEGLNIVSQRGPVSMFTGPFLPKL